MLHSGNVIEVSQSRYLEENVGDGQLQWPAVKNTQPCFVVVFFSHSVPIPERPVTSRQGKEGSDEGRKVKLRVSNPRGWRTLTSSQD